MIFRKFSQGYCIHVANLKRIRPVVGIAISNRKCRSRQPLLCEFLLYTNKRPPMNQYFLNFMQVCYDQRKKWLKFGKDFFSFSRLENHNFFQKCALLEVCFLQVLSTLYIFIHTTLENELVHIKNAIKCKELFSVSNLLQKGAESDVFHISCCLEFTNLQLQTFTTEWRCIHKYFLVLKKRYVVMV